MLTSRLLSLFLIFAFASTSAGYQTFCEEAIPKCEANLREELAEAEDDVDRCHSAEYFGDCLEKYGCYDTNSDHPAQLVDQKVEELCPSCEEQHDYCRRDWESLNADAVDDGDRCDAVLEWKYCIGTIHADFCERKYPDDISTLEDQYC